MSDEDDRRKGPGFLVAAAVVAALVLAGIGLTAVSLIDGSDEDPTSSSSTSASPAPSDEGGDAEESVCGLPGHETTGSVNRAPKAEWTLIDGLAVPSVEDAGPGQEDEDGFRSCYAHTPEGALLFAANFIGMGAEPSFEERLVNQSLAPGPGQAAAKKRVGQESSSESGGIQIAGFRVVSYSGEEATVDILMRTDEGDYVYQQFDLRWVKGDWRMVPADDGGFRSEPSVVPDASGFIAWSGV